MLRKAFLLLLVLILIPCISHGETKTYSLDSNSAKADNHRGVAWDKKGDYDRAISDYSKAIELNPRYAEAYNNRAVAYYFKRQHGKAWDDIHKLQNLGSKVHPGFLKALREASGRQE
jgi:tetratricopeptide (TPR) repeat protein